jgi:hypothetical protein
MKLNVRKWHYLDCVRVSLADLASLLGAGMYKESYERDLRLPRTSQSLASETDVAGKTYRSLTKCCHSNIGPS